MTALRSDATGHAHRCTVVLPTPIVRTIAPTVCPHGSHFPLATFNLLDAMLLDRPGPLLPFSTPPPWPGNPSVLGSGGRGKARSRSSDRENSPLLAIEPCACGGRVAGLASADGGAPCGCGMPDSG